MVAIRCTQRLLEHIGPASPASKPTTTLLGDWYATPVGNGAQRLILLISERSCLPIIVPSREVKGLLATFPEALARVLAGLGIPTAVSEREVAATREAVIAATKNRSLIGALMDLSFALRLELRDEPTLDLLGLALLLSRAPVRALGQRFPDTVTRELLA